MASTARILFWNVHKKDLRQYICALAKSESIDVIALIECRVPIAHTLSSLQQIDPGFFHVHTFSQRFHIFARDHSLGLQSTFSSSRISIHALKIQNIELNIGFVHLWDPLNWNKPNQISQTTILAKSIVTEENRLNNSRTILIGDFNLNPFDSAMNIASGLNAMPTRQCVANGYRIVAGVRYGFFYNPMWGLFGDATTGPPGTFYYGSNNGHFGWNMLDQVLLRPDAIPYFSSVRIIDGTSHLRIQTKKGRPDRKKCSDHFPLLVELRSNV